MHHDTDHDSGSEAFDQRAVSARLLELAAGTWVVASQTDTRTFLRPSECRSESFVPTIVVDDTPPPTSDDLQPMTTWVVLADRRDADGPVLADLVLVDGVGTVPLTQRVAWVGAGGADVATRIVASAELADLLELGGLVDGFLDQIDTEAVR